MKKLKIPSNLTTLAYNSAKAYILDGLLDEESRLTEDFLAGQLGISKSPIREALNRLEADGLIQIEPRKGAYLRRLSIEDIHELYRFREALEVHVVRTAKLTPALLAELPQAAAHPLKSERQGTLHSGRHAVSRQAGAIYKRTSISVPSSRAFSTRSGSPPPQLRPSPAAALPITTTPF